MEQERLNIAEILKDYPDGTKLYSNTFGNVTLKQVDIMDNFPIIIEWNDGHSCAALKNDGRYINVHDAECCLFPSKGMRDWEKMKWKRGDMLYSEALGCFTIFAGWANDEYTMFDGRYIYNSAMWRDKSFYDTKLFDKANENDTKDYFKKMEKTYGGTLNRETLEIEKDEDKKPKEPEHTFKPFDKVLVRNNEEDEWRAAFFEYEFTSSSYPYRVIGAPTDYRQCIPYEGNEHLIETIHEPTNK